MPPKLINPDYHPDELDSMGFPGVGGTSADIVNLYLEQGTNFIASFFDLEQCSPEHIKLCKALLPAYLTACATVHAAKPQTLTVKGSYR